MDPTQNKIAAKTHAIVDKYVGNTIHAIVLILSLILIGWISYDTFNKLHFLNNHAYMTFQLWVCIVFFLDFFIELYMTDKKKKYLKHKWFFFLIAIPYLNIINEMHLNLPQNVLYYLRFVPLFRGAYALTMVLGYISKNKAVSMLSQYITILLALVYIMALIFYYQEYGINKYVKSFWDALYWSAMNMTTVGCYFPAVTTVGKVISVILPIGGMLMLPLFTVYITDLVRKHNAQNPNDQVKSS